IAIILMEGKKGTLMRGIYYFVGLLTCFLVFGFSGKAFADSTYQEVYSNTPANYYLKVGNGTSRNNGIYQTGGRLTSAQNVDPIAYASQYAGKEVHVNREEVTIDGTWLKIAYQHKTVGWIHKSAMNQSYLRLNVPMVAQRPQLPTGCEIAATTMMLQYAGADVTKMQLAREMPRSKNPNKGFVGNPYSTSGWWIYPKGLMKLVKNHAGSAINMTGAGFGRIKQSIRQDHPVVVWVHGVDGFVNHALAITGYSATRAYYNDPWTAKRASMTVQTLQRHRSRDAYRALSY
ncbi:MAG: C39 family peptidase, partial [Lentilactobacillus hilgardii]